MPSTNPSTNSGVHNSAGIEFQKHCAIHILLSRYNELKAKKYFICLEHHDDLLFCFQDSQSAVSSIEAYQAKKSSTAWTMGSSLFIILKKLTQTGLDLISDSHPKSPKYAHTLDFITNDSITLHCGTTPLIKRKTLLINESNDSAKYLAIDAAIQKNIQAGLKKESVTDLKQIKELDNLGLIFIDLPKKAKDQRNTLIGLMHSIFANNISDPTAAVSALLQIFRNVETVLNNSNIAHNASTSSIFAFFTVRSIGFAFWITSTV